MKVNSHLKAFQKAKKTNKIRQRFFSAFLTLLFLFIFCFSSVAADESDNVLVNTYSYNCSSFYFTNLSTGTSWSADALPFSGSSDFNFNRVGSNPSYEFNGVTRVYSIYSGIINTEDIFDQDYTYFSLELDSAVLSSNALIEDVWFTGYDENGTPHNILSSFDSNYGITVNYQGVDFSGVNTFFYGEISSLIDYSLVSVQGILTVRLASGSPAVVTSPLTIKFYKNYQDVLVDVNSNVQQIINQNDVIINNMNEVKSQIADLKDSLTTNDSPKNPEFDSNVSNAESIEKEFADKFQDFIDTDLIDRVEANVSTFFQNDKVLAAFVFVRSILNAAFVHVPVLGILFAFGSAALVVTALLSIASRAFRSERSSDRSYDPPVDYLSINYWRYSSNYYYDSR